jgi:glycosyltransferase involved in cell wall biosynthesis
LLQKLEKALLDAGAGNFQFQIVGDGTERRWLEQNMRHAEFTGVLIGEPLSREYANMDAFVFPSRTDTFGNVVQEAMASGLPAVVSDSGGPKSIVRHGVTGFIASDVSAFRDAILTLMKDPLLCNQMSVNAREQACNTSWDSIFNDVLKAYDTLWPRSSSARFINSQSPQSSNGNTACMFSK